MPLTFLWRTITIAALGACVLFALPAWGAKEETAPPFSPDKSSGIVVADAYDATRTADADGATGIAVAAGEDDPADETGGAEAAATAGQDEPADSVDEPTAASDPNAPDIAAAAEPSTPPTAGMDDARALIDAGRFAEALNILGPLVSSNVVEANAVFLYGLAALGASQHPEVSDENREALLNEAVGAFHAMLIEEPGLMRVRLELARAFFLKGEDELARRHFEYVLAGDPPATVVANVQRFLREIEGRGRWSFRLGAALAPDSNIGGTSDERTIYIFDLPFERDQEELTTSGIGVSVWGGAEYQYVLDEDLRLRAGAEFARREYERSQFDQLFVGTHLGPRWQVDENLGVSVLASVRQRWLGTVPDHRGLGGRLEVNRRLSRSVTLGASASWHGRRYRTRDYLDGPIFDSSLRAAWIAMPTVRLELSGGYGWERPRSERWRTRSHWAGLGVSVILPLGFNVGAGAEMRWTDYHESEGSWFPNISDGSAREDRTRSVRLSVHNRGFTLMGFSPELVAVHEERETNAQLYDYERTRGELRFVRQF